MHTDLIKVDPAQAALLFRKYKEHAAYSNPIDQEIQRAYQLIARGKTIIKAIESVKSAGLNREFLPKLALTGATAEKCYLRRYDDGAAVMSSKPDMWRENKWQLRFPSGTFVFPSESFPINHWNKQRTDRTDHEAILPIVPIHLRPKRGIANYHVLWEAEWSRAVPVDPMLLRRIGRSDLWLVCAAWELTEVEVAALSTRVSR